MSCRRHSAKRLSASTQADSRLYCVPKLKFCVCINAQCSALKGSFYTCTNTRYAVQRDGSVGAFLLSGTPKKGEIHHKTQHKHSLGTRIKTSGSVQTAEGVSETHTLAGSTFTHKALEGLSYVEANKLHIPKPAHMDKTVHTRPSTPLSIFHTHTCTHARSRHRE